MPAFTDDEDFVIARAIRHYDIYEASIHIHPENYQYDAAVELMLRGWLTSHYPSIFRPSTAALLYYMGIRHVDF